MDMSLTQGTQCRISVRHTCDYAIELLEGYETLRCILEGRFHIIVRPGAKGEQLLVCEEVDVVRGVDRLRYPVYLVRDFFASVTEKVTQAKLLTYLVHLFAVGRRPQYRLCWARVTSRNIDTVAAKCLTVGSRCAACSPPWR